MVASFSAAILVAGVLVFANGSPGVSAKPAALTSTPPSATPAAPATPVTTEAAAPVTTSSPPDTTASPTLKSGDLLISLAIDDTYARGKDKAFACDVIQVFCLGVNDSVSSPAGELRSGCHLSWQLYPGDSSTLIDQGSIQYCGEELFLGRNPMAPGTYRAKLNVELDDGTTATTTYTFALLPRT